VREVSIAAPKTTRRLSVLAALCALAVSPTAIAADGEQVLSLEGRISPQAQYLIRVDYATTVNDRSCQFEDSITGLWIRKLDSRYEHPTINGDSHSLKIPLTHPGGVGACSWQPSVVYACVGPRGAADAAASCTPLFVMTPLGGKPAASISLACDPQSWRCATTDGKIPGQEVSGFPDPIRLDIAATAAH
jgi:hypothetical protein